MAQKRKKRVAVVQCAGGCRAESKVSGEELSGNCQQRMEQYPDGILLCRDGCLGGGSCVEACRLNAVFINTYGTAQIDREKCVGCGLCVKACPKGLIRLTEPEYPIYPACVNRDPGPQTRKGCSVGCIGCGICVKSCPAGAISIIDGHAVIDEEKCIACGMCAMKCPRGTIHDADGIFTDKI